MSVLVLTGLLVLEVSDRVQRDLAGEVPEAGVVPSCSPPAPRPRLHAVEETLHTVCLPAPLAPTTGIESAVTREGVSFRADFALPL